MRSGSGCIASAFLVCVGLPRYAKLLVGRNDVNLYRGILAGDHCIACGAVPVFLRIDQDSHVLQLAAAVAFLALMRLEGMLTPDVYVPFLQTYIHLNWTVYMIFAAFVIVGTVNAVNITDGLDGLATTVTVPVALFFVSVATWWGYTQLGIFAGAMLGGLLGFLIFNAYPAKVFMGDTGSLFLGGAVAGLAFAFDMPLVLVLVGIVYIVETLSDIIQVTYFKLTHGKRIFKMAPIHHHFEMCGWSEIKIVVIFTVVSAVFCALAYFGVMGRVIG